MSERHTDLMTIAFDGRPIEWSRGQPGEGCAAMLRIHHENGVHHCEVGLTNADLRLAEADLDEFKRRIVVPILHNLDIAAYPDRYKRALAAIKRLHELAAA